MKIIEVTYGRTFNLGNYESLRIEFRASVEDGENVQKTIADLSSQAMLYKTQGER